MPDKHPLRYEDAACKRTLTGWACVRCERFHGSGASAERSARYCCATDLPCSCGGRVKKGYAICAECSSLAEAKKWEALPKVEWDGETPLCEWRGERCFRTQEDLLEHYMPWDDNLAEPVEEIRLVLCKEWPIPEFEIVDFLSDHLAEDQDIPGEKEANARINTIIAEYAPPSWTTTGKGVSVESLRKWLRVEG